MAVRPGYKQTEIGIVPEDWGLVSLGGCAKFRTGPFGSLLHQSDYTTDGIPVINPMHLVNGKIEPTRTMTVTKAAAKGLADFLLRRGDVVIGRRGGMGRCAVVQAGQTGWLCGTGSMIIRCENSIDANFLQRVLSSPRVITAIENMSVGTTMVNLNQDVLARLQIQFPTLAEQRAIAEALKDVDALLGGLERLIAKKQHLKKAAMQQLLTGRSRIPGFRAKWAMTVFESLCRSFTKQTGFDYSASIKQSLTFEDNRASLPFIQNKDFSGNETNYRTDYFIPEKVAINFPRILLDERCFLISISGRVGNVGVFSNKRQAFVGGAIAVAKFKDTRYLDWVMYYLQSNEGQTKLLANVKAGSHQNLILDDLRKIEIPLPSPEEQKEIIAVLLGMDSELAALQQRQEKTRSFKQAMMQELLTGKTRLI